MIVVFQFLYFFVDFNTKPNNVTAKQQWVALPDVKDATATYKKKGVYVMRPFNPNFITDFKGYRLA